MPVRVSRHRLWWWRGLGHMYQGEPEGHDQEATAAGGIADFAFGIS